MSAIAPLPAPPAAAIVQVDPRYVSFRVGAPMGAPSSIPPGSVAINANYFWQGRPIGLLINHGKTIRYIPCPFPQRPVLYLIDGRDARFSDETVSPAPEDRARPHVPLLRPVETDAGRHVRGGSSRPGVLRREGQAEGAVSGGAEPDDPDRAALAPDPILVCFDWIERTFRGTLSLSDLRDGDPGRVPGRPRLRPDPRPESLPSRHVSAISAGPRVVRRGRASTGAELRTEKFRADVHRRANRTAVGTRRDGKLILVFARNRTLGELARILLKYGCVEAMNLDGGHSASLRYRGRCWGASRPYTVLVISPRAPPARIPR